MRSLHQDDGDNILPISLGMRREGEVSRTYLTFGDIEGVGAIRNMIRVVSSTAWHNIS